MTNLAKQRWVLDIQDIPDVDRKRLFEIIRDLDIIRGNDLYYSQNLCDQVWVEKGVEKRNDNFPYEGSYLEMYDILVKYVPRKILVSDFIFKIWW